MKISVIDSPSFICDAHMSAQRKDNEGDGNRVKTAATTSGNLSNRQEL
jgi:hypothetical protein